MTTRTMVLFVAISILISGEATLAAERPPCSVEVSAQQAKGYVSGSASIYRKREWDEAGVHKVKWDHVKGNDLSKSTTSFHVSPGTYKVSFYVGGTRQETEEFRLAGTDSRRFSFDVATVHIGAQQAKGYVSGSASIYRKREWDEAGVHKVKWDHVKGNDLSRSTTRFHVIPGTYKVSFYVGGTRQETDEFTLRGTQEETFSFNAATVFVGANQAKGYVSGSASIYRKRVWDEVGIRKVKWDHVKGNDLNQGTTRFHVIPGTYKVSFYVGGTRQETDEFELLNTQESTHRFQAVTVYVGARQPKGYVTGSASLYRKREWNEAGVHKVKWDHVKGNDLSQGTTRFYAIPGEYRVTVYFSSDKSRKESQPLLLSGTQEATVVFDSTTGGIRYRRGDRRDEAHTGQPEEEIPDTESTYKRTPVVDDLLDASLRRAGIDPTDELARKAKRLGKDTLNPFKSADDLQKDIDALVDEIRITK